MGQSVHDAVALVVEKVRDAGEAANTLLGRVEPWRLAACCVLGTVTFIHVRRVLRRSDRPILERISGSLFSMIRRIPYVRAKIEKELSGTQKYILQTIHRCDKERIFVVELPESGLSTDNILKLASKYEAMGTVNVDEGRVSGAVYTDRDEDHVELLKKVFRSYAFSNPLHPDVFPGCRKMEAEVVRMVANMYHGNKDVCGTMTSGGTESIMLAMFAYRNKAHAAGISDPEIIVPVTAHAAFDKAANLFAVRIRHIPVDSNNRVDLRAMRRAISSETCVLVGSAPNFPSGTIDDIVEISKMGAKYGIPVHVDACLGGFLIPFMEEAGFELPLFDFRLPGVTSVSCDTHKYGYAPKGSSLVLYRTAEYLHHQYFCIPQWTGGIYATPTFAGSRCGSSIALTWASLMHFGREGYVKRTRAIIECSRTIAEGITGTSEKPGIDGLLLLGSSDVSVVAFTSDVINIYAIADRMTAHGWNLNSLQNPSAVHICVTYNTAVAGAAQAFLSDLRCSIQDVLRDPNLGGDSNTAALYGLAASIPDKSLVNEVAFAFLDACYAMPEKAASE